MFNYDKTKKVDTLSIMILTINMDGFYCNYFLAVDLNLLNFYQWLHQRSEVIMGCYEECDIDYILMIDVGLQENHV